MSGVGWDRYLSWALWYNVRLHGYWRLSRGAGYKWGLIVLGQHWDMALFFSKGDGLDSIDSIIVPDIGRRGVIVCLASSSILSSSSPSSSASRFPFWIIVVDVGTWLCLVLLKESFDCPTLFSWVPSSRMHHARLVHGSNCFDCVSIDSWGIHGGSFLMKEMVNNLFVSDFLLVGEDLVVDQVHAGNICQKLT